MHKERDRLLRELREFYDANDLATYRFDCQHLPYCEKLAQSAGRGLKNGAEAHVGSRYGERLRVVVVSLDSAGGTFDLEERQKDIESVWGRSKINPHMRGTIRLLQQLFDIDSDTSPLPFYAMTNSAKCTADDGKPNMVPDELFERCRPYAHEELKILAPEIVVTQGRRAKSVLSDVVDLRSGWLESVLAVPPASDAPLRDWLLSLAQRYLREWDHGTHRALVIHAPHPSARGGQWKRFAELDLGPLAWLARRLVLTDTSHR